VALRRVLSSIRARQHNIAFRNNPRTSDWTGQNTIRSLRTNARKANTKAVKAQVDAAQKNQIDIIFNGGCI